MKNRALTFSKWRLIICVFLAVASVGSAAVMRYKNIGYWENGLFTAFLLILLIPQRINVQNQKRADMIALLWVLFMAFFAFIICQLAIDAGIGAVGIKNIFLNVFCILFVFFLLISCFGRVKPAVFVSTFLFLVFISADYFVIFYRGREISPADFQSLGIAADVAEEFEYKIGPTLIYAWIDFLLLCIASFMLPKETKSPIQVRSRLAALAMSVAMALAGYFGCAGMKSDQFLNCGAGINGFIINLVLQFKEQKIVVPEGYSLETIQFIEDSYHEDEREGFPEHRPDIIVIMDESFADLNVLGDKFSPSEEVMPFVKNLHENAVKGFAMTSVFGGGTANSEYEFLTGNTLMFLPQNAIAFQQYIREPVWSLVSDMKSRGYTCVSMHPFLEHGWERSRVYPMLGFDSSLFLDGFPQKNIVRNYVSDEEMFDVLISEYEQYSKEESSLFLWGVTMQNHGGYTYSENDFTTTIKLDGLSKPYPDAEQYLSLIHESDRALRELVHYFESVDRDVVIVFYGDHLPGLKNEFFEELHGGSFDTLDEQMKKNMVPFFIWANYDIEEAEVKCTSLNFLPCFLYKAAGMTPPAYVQFLEDVMQEIPSISANGFYSKAEHRFLPYYEASGKEKEILRQYEYLQYNAVFDTENRSQRLFALR